MLDGVATPQKTHVYSQRVLLDSALHMNAQWEAGARISYCQFSPVELLHPFMGKKNLTIVTYTLVISRLNHCNTVYVRFP